MFMHHFLEQYHLSAQFTVSDWNNLHLLICVLYLIIQYNIPGCVSNQDQKKKHKQAYRKL